MKTNRLFLLALFLSVSILAIPAHALRNPSAVYCQSLGYTYVTRETPDGTVGSCQISGSVACGAWDFLWGKCGTDYSYCAKQGLGQRSGRGSECGVDNKNAECLVCILSDGSIREVTEVMNLSVVEGVCGDGACIVGENSQNCPKDCPASVAQASPKTIRYKYWDLENETSTSIPAQEKNAQSSTTVPGKSSGSSFSSLYLVVILVALLLVLFIGLRILKNRKS